jgi:DNA repair exonuclease SbcCD ATPase subunit
MTTAVLTAYAREKPRLHQSHADISGEAAQVDNEIGEWTRETLQAAAGLLDAEETLAQQRELHLSSVQQSCQAAEQKLAELREEQQQQLAQMESLRAAPALADQETAALQRESAELQRQIKECSITYRAQAKKLHELGEMETKVSTR